MNEQVKEQKEYIPLAFPNHVNLRYASDFQIDYGMSLLDYFAAKAMSGLCAGDKRRAITEMKSLASVSYEIADAMLEERKKRLT